MTMPAALTLFYLSYVNEMRQLKKIGVLAYLNSGIDLINHFPINIWNYFLFSY